MTVPFTQPVHVRAQLAATCLHQMIGSGSEYNHITLYPFVAATQIFLQRPIVIATYILSDTSTSGRLAAPRLLASSSLNISRKSTKEMANLFRAKTDEARAFSPHVENIKKYGVFVNDLVSPVRHGLHAKEADDVELLFCLYSFPDGKSGGDIYPIPVDDPIQQEFREFLSTLESSGESWKNITTWLSRIIRVWIGRRRSFKSRRISASNTRPPVIYDDSDLSILEGDRIIHDVVDTVYQRIKESPLLTYATKTIPSVLFAFKSYILSDKNTPVPIAKYIIPPSQNKDLSQPLVSEVPGYRATDGSWTRHLDKLRSTNILSENGWVRDCFETGNIIITEKFPAASEVPPASNVEVDDSFREVCLRLVDYKSYRLLICPIWLGGQPYAVVVFPIACRDDNPSEEWYHIYLLFSEMFKSNISRRLRARIRERYAEHLFEVARRSWAPALAEASPSIEGRDALLGECIRTFTNSIYLVSYIFPFPILRIRIGSNGSTTHDEDWIGRFGSTDLFVYTDINPVFTPRYDRTSNFILYRGKNALRRSLRDSRVQFVNLLSVANYESPAHATLCLIAERISSEASLVTLRYHAHSPMIPLLSELAYAVHKRFGVGKDRIRLYAPGLCKAEDDRYIEHIENAVIGIASYGGARLRRRTDTVVIFMDAPALKMRAGTDHPISPMRIEWAIEQLLAEYQDALRVIVVTNMKPSSSMSQAPIRSELVDVDKFYEVTEAVFRMESDNEE